MDEHSLRNLAEEKEKEWRGIQEKRIEALEKAVKQKTHDLGEEKTKFAQLKEDFKYNFKLLEERDAELEKYEQTIIATRKQQAEQDGEISDLKIKIDELKTNKDKEKNSLDECKKYYHNRLNQKQNEVDKYKSSKDAEINKERHEIEKHKRTLERQLQDLQIDLETQRNELKTEFDDILRKREHEWRLKTEEFSTQELAKELQIKMLTNELNQLRETTSSLQSNSNDTETNLKMLERKLRDKEWELKDTIVLKDAKIKEIETKINKIQSNTKTANEELNRKNDDMDRTIRDKELCMEKLKMKISEHETNQSYLEEQITEYKLQIKHLSQSNKDNEKDKDKEIISLNEEIFKLKNDMNKEIEIKAKDTVRKDMTVEDLRQSNEELSNNLIKRNEEIEYFKSQAADSLNKINELEHEKLQLNLDWERKYQYLEKIKAKDSEEFNMQILDSRDHALTKIKTLEDKLNHKENVIKALQTADPSLNMIEFDSNEFKLKEENDKLKGVIKIMREEMENIASNPNEIAPLKEKSSIQEFNGLGNGFSNQGSFNNSSEAKHEFEEDLKRQLQEAKQKNRQLQSQLDEHLLTLKLPDNMSDNTVINSHIKSMNETICILRKEKMDLTAFCKKQQTKLLHIEKNSSELAEHVRLKQTQIETLQYEMNSQTRRNTTEINNLKQTLANSELELSGTRREADEYHKATIEKSSEIAALDSKIGELKLKLSQSGTHLNFGAQELFIQQLQDEIKRLGQLNSQLLIKSRQQHHESMRELQDKESTNNTQKSDPLLNELVIKKEIISLKSKLKSAAKFISHLIQEKEHLIEMSNKLRGELNRIKYDNDSLSLVRINRDVSDQLLQNQTPYTRSISPSYQTALATQLQKLEKQQYELTKKQLAFSNQKNMAKSDSMLNKAYKNTNYQSSESPSTDDNNQLYSSIKSDNFKEIWQLIDDHENNPVMQSSDDHISSAIKIQGFKPSSLSKKKDQVNNVTFSSKSPRIKSAGSKTESKLAKPKIRNYNDKT